jgi:hypothetical protein
MLYNTCIIHEKSHTHVQGYSNYTVNLTFKFISIWSRRKIYCILWNTCTCIQYIQLFIVHGLATTLCKQEFTVLEEMVHYMLVRMVSNVTLSVVVITGLGWMSLSSDISGGLVLSTWEKAGCPGSINSIDIFRNVICYVILPYLLAAIIVISVVSMQIHYWM